MNKEQIYEFFGISVNESFSNPGSFLSLRNNRTSYVAVRVDHLEDDEIMELDQFSKYFVQKGDQFTATFVPSKSKLLFALINDQRYALLQYKNYPYRKQVHIAKELAKFHHIGRGFPYSVTRTARIGQWKYLWEKRLDQMEIFWGRKIKAENLNAFDEKFLCSFPYYLGITENAIQFLVDTELDEQPYPVDSATVCHQRFTENTWSHQQLVRFPTDWVFDHPSRDVAEWLRHQYFKAGKFDNRTIPQFIYHYGRSKQLSPFFIRILFARLLFPIHYFDCIEEYYRNYKQENEERNIKALDTILQTTKQYEYFLKEVYDYMSYVNQQGSLKKMEWLYN
ncbi:spore coat putative kinase YutH [Cytobacillus sp. IB215665]|uniref:spore coat putative kinase YutH n=1 Tax=Cytobacillus sp. IB215665 TaxID=3097357 RepID=UPI002A12FB20|nr:spore coat protein YutH [Cytobacillus sp. IB215665]MDX8365932.1 spore coat protein YutH [Cytobacillus sp. IB215665]